MSKKKRAKKEKSMFISINDFDDEIYFISFSNL